MMEELISDYGLFSSYEGLKNGQDSWGVFQGCTGLWTAGCRLARRLHQLKASTTTMDLVFIYFPCFCMTCGLEKLGLVHQKPIGA